MTPLHDLTIGKIRDGLRAKKFSALEIAQAFFEYIKDKDPEIGAYLSLRETEAAREAEATDLALAKGEALGPLAGVPMAVKDNMLVVGGPATAASRILEHYVSAYDATVIAKLKAAGAVILGKTNLDEFAMGSSTENSAFQVTKNPHDPTRVAGGSSGGSAAAVAANMAVAALGSDTGGSIRQPAALCGVVGMKPTYGTVSRSGIIAMASSLDQVGPFAKTVEDAAIVFDVIRGIDPLDATSVDQIYGTDLLRPKLENVKKLTVGLPEEYFIDGLDPEVAGAVEQAVKQLESLGVKFKKISLPHTKYALSCYYIIMPAEVSSNLARFDGIRYARLPGIDDTEKSADRSALLHAYLKQKGLGYGPETKRRVILGTFVLSSGYYDAYYEKAQRVRTLIKQDFDLAFRNVDVVLTPVTPTPAFKIGEKTDDPLAMYLSDIFTIPVNLAGLPGISIPVRPKKGLPVGFQLIGQHFREADILGLGQYYDKITSA
ncbi:MAG TPA: Asp-tRNA(Asn)/Glu-tRNA(Gln) amidotransferase subunit GatA [Candidatus Paceibacterota bacterium]|nr:Asp-tRNA(Asn)/Glu-tRNA(Gln) amidotransferase subunit GatA [Candidatus Paceibacterota bacterium]